MCSDHPQRHLILTLGLVLVLPACRVSANYLSIKIGIPALFILMALSIGILIRMNRNIRTRLEKLRRSEEQKRLVYNHTVSGVALHEIVLDPEGKPVDYVFLDANAAFEKQTGLCLSEIIGRRATEVVAPEELKNTPFIEIFGNVAVTGEPISFEPSQPRLGRYFLINAFRIGHGKFAAILTDITEQKRDRAERERSESRLRRLVDILQHPSESIQEFLDYALEQAIELTDSKIGYIYHYHEDRKEFVLNTWSKDVMAECAVTDPQTCYELDKTGIWGEAVRQRRPIVINDFESTNPLKKGLPKGHVKLYKFMTVPVFHGNEIVGVVGLANKETDYVDTDVFQITLLMEVVWKVTERKRTDEALRDSEARLSAITHSARDAILMMDPNGMISYWNPAAEAIFGYRRDEVIGKSLHELLVPERYQQAFKDTFPEFVRTGKGNVVGKTIDVSSRRKDGLEIEVALSLSAVKFENAWHAVGILRDITAMKKAEQDLISANRQLEAATAHANEMAVKAETANNAKSEFLANMSHEIRTPLNGVIGMAGFLLDTKLSDEQRHFADVIRSGGESLLGLINDILDFSKIEARKLDLEIMDFDLSTMLDDFAATMALRAHEKGLELICSADVDVPVLLRGDPGRLRQILTNLTGNAIKFTHNGEVAIRVSIANREKTENSQKEHGKEKQVLLHFAVRDTGIGIPEDKTCMLFQKFTQIDASTTRQFGGTGLGLAISKQLAEMMGGEIGVQSEAGKGSEFWFTVQLEIQPETDRRKISTPADLRGVRALIVDDNATNREILVTQMASWEMRPSAVESGSEALPVLVNAVNEKDPFEVVVIDMQMPGMDGEELGRSISEDSRLNNTRKVMMTSLGVRGEAKRFAEVGFEAYLTKPTRRLELKSVLSQVLGTTYQAASTLPKLVTRHTAMEKSNLFSGSKVRILLAEDNLTNRQVAVGLLNKLGLSADAVADGAEVMKALVSVPYDIVLMDVQMPVMDGLETTRQIRNPKSAVPNHEIPVIAMTAHAMQGDREKCLKAGMNGYVSKPVSLQRLAEALEPWIARNNGIGLPIPKAEKRVMKERRRYQRNASHPGIFDRGILLDRLAGDEALTQRVVEGFLEDIPKQLEALKEAIWQEKADAAGSQAHKIKGAAANIGGNDLCETAFIMEKAGKTGDLEQMKALMPQLERSFGQLKKAMEIG